MVIQVKTSVASNNAPSTHLKMLLLWVPTPILKMIDYDSVLTELPNKENNWQTSPNLTEHNKNPNSFLDPSKIKHPATHTKQSVGDSNAKPDSLPNPWSTQGDLNNTEDASRPEDEPENPEYPDTDLDSDYNLVNKIPSLQKWEVWRRG